MIDWAAEMTTGLGWRIDLATDSDPTSTTRLGRRLGPDLDDD